MQCCCGVSLRGLSWENPANVETHVQPGWGANKQQPPTVSGSYIKHTYVPLPDQPVTVFTYYTWLRSRPNSLVRTKFCRTSIMFRGEICASVS